jgi:Calx-beta domain
MKSFASSFIIVLIAVLALGSAGEAQILLRPTVQFRQTFVRVTEGQASVTLVAELSFASAAEIAVPFMVENPSLPEFSLASVPGDLGALPTGFLFPPGTTRAEVSIPVGNDTVAEAREETTIELCFPDFAGRFAFSGRLILIEPTNLPVILGNNDECRIVITDDDKPVVTLTRSQLEVSEGQSSVVLTAELSMPSEERIAVPFMVENHDRPQFPLAAVPGDLGVLPAMFFFPPGSTRQEVVIPVVDDLLVESREEVTLELCVPGSMIWLPITTNIGRLIIGDLIGISPEYIPFIVGDPDECTLVISDNDSAPIAPEVVGSYAAFIDGETRGKIDFTCTAQGHITGALTVGNTRKAFVTDLMTTNAEFAISVPSLHLKGLIDITTNLFSGSLSEDSTVEGWRKVWNARTNPSASHAGYFTALFTEGNHGFFCGTINQGGNLIGWLQMKGLRLQTFSSLLGPRGEIGFYQTLDATGRAVLGRLDIEGSDMGSVTGLVKCSSPETETLMTGAKYRCLGGEVIPGLKLGQYLTIHCEVPTINVLAMLNQRGGAVIRGANPQGIWLNFNPRSGLFFIGNKSSRNKVSFGIMARASDGLLGVAPGVRLVLD